MAGNKIKKSHENSESFNKKYYENFYKGWEETISCHNYGCVSYHELNPILHQVRMSDNSLGTW